MGWVRRVLRALGWGRGDDGSGRPYESPPGRHRHQCPTCAAVWEHEDGLDLRPPHRCPRCGVLAPSPWPKYNGPLGPDYDSVGTPRSTTPRL